MGSLLGGRYIERVRPYCSLLMEMPDRMHDVVAPYKARGFKAFKVGWGPFGRTNDAGLDRAIIAATRDALGPDVQLFVDPGASDAHWPQGLKWALRSAEMLADYQVGWFEEALKPDALEDFCTLRRASPVPIAGGEVLTRRQSFLPWLERGAFDIVQPDVTKVGGISEQRRIVWMAQDYGVRYVGHGWNTALGVAADLHLATAFPGVDLVEFIGGSPYVDGILREPFVLDADGMLPIPNKPGLGIELDPAGVARYTPDAEPFFAA